MKKLFLLLISAAVAVSASAAVFTHPMTNEMKNRDIITEQPAGELKTFNRTGQYNYVVNYTLSYGEQEGKTIDIVFAEDGKVYLKNIICGFEEGYADSWVEGQLNADGTQITVPLGQPLYYSPSYNANLVIGFGEVYVAYGYYMFDVDQNVSEAVYVIDGANMTLQGNFNFDDAVGHGYGFGAYWDDDRSWSGFTEYNTVLTDPNFVPVDPTQQCAKPEGGFENGVDFHGVTVTLVNNETAEGTELHYSITLNGELVVEDAIYDEPFALTQDGEYYIDFWATAPDMLDSSHGGLIFTIDQTTGLSELLNGKTVAGVRYYNMAGQEITEANGLTIVVTTYTDGTTSAVKVVK